ncbi:23S rRNA (uracil(1939)-C(5))-methyltransferase RlmD [Leuconostocaceae bacterium ESL0958]|nr:23S rRNA (uracil(1939)-C(5))-methyltransferase RlmD [Leuconostocaceae bacterium ESL0958]
MARTKLPVTLGERLVVTVDHLLQSAMGVAYVNEAADYPIYLADAMVGEEVDIEIIQVDKHSAYGRIRSWLQPAAGRVDQGRPELIAAGTAPLVNWAYPEQVAFKKQEVARLFAAAGLSVQVADPITMDDAPTYYRNKTVVPLKWQDGQLLSGFYKRGTSHELVPMTDYYVNDRRLDEVIVTVRDVLAKHAITAFDQDRGQGAIRYVMVRRGYYSQELMVVLVSNEPALPEEDAVVADIVAALPDITSLIFNYAPKKDYVLLSADNRTLYGQSAIHDQLLGRDFLIGPNSFYQVNPPMTEKLYQTAAELAELKKTDVVVDAYAGIGTIGITVADRVKEVLGVEVVPGAVADARLNVAANQLENATYWAADAPAQFVAWAAEGLRPDVVFVDPPRRGLTAELIAQTVLMGPDRLVYISCNPKTAARDVALFTAKGYRIKGPVVPVDQFPQTAHIETITVLERDH